MYEIFERSPFAFQMCKVKEIENNITVKWVYGSINKHTTMYTYKVQEGMDF